MEHLVRLWEWVRDKVGWVASLFIALALLLLGSAHLVSESTLKPAISGFGAILLIIGILLGLLNAFSAYFQTRPARGLVDGALAGLIAGTVGGLLGYGSHVGPSYVDAGFVRVGICIAFSVPLGSVAGLVCDLVHPDRDIDWRRYFAAITLAVAVLLVASVGATVMLVPVMKGAGISIFDLQLVFEVFLLTSAALASFSFAWSLKRFLSQGIFILISIAVARSVTSFVTYSGRCQAGEPIGQVQFNVDPGCDEGGPLFAMTVLAFLIWTVFSYAAFFRARRNGSAGAVSA